MHEKTNICKYSFDRQDHKSSTRIHRDIDNMTTIKRVPYKGTVMDILESCTRANMQNTKQITGIPGQIQIGTKHDTTIF